MASSIQIEYVAMREKCSYADKYKAIRKPTCGCRACEKKWQEKTTVTPDSKKVVSQRMVCHRLDR